MRGMLSFLYPIFLSPSSWIVILVILSFIVKHAKRKKVLRIVALVLFLIFSSPLLKNFFDYAWQGQRTKLQAGKTYSCGIVLGGFASVDADNFGYFNGAADRFIQVLRLYKTGTIRNIVVSGGNSRRLNKQFGEATFTKQELMVMGVPDSCIFVEDQSSNTADNAVNSRKLLDSLKIPPPYLLITSAVHMPRASLLFKKSGLQTDYFTTNYSGALRKFNVWMLIPSMEVLLNWNVNFKEAVGYWWYK